jgi:hypothetical protein
MNPPRAVATVEQTTRPPAKPERTEAGRIPSGDDSSLKPTGPVTYKIEKGSNVWPWLK